MIRVRKRSEKNRVEQKKTQNTADSTNAEQICANSVDRNRIGSDVPGASTAAPPMLPTTVTPDDAALR